MSHSCYNYSLPQQEEEAAQAALGGPTEELEPTPAPEPEPERVINIAGFEISQKVLVALVGCLIFIVFGIVAFVKLGKKKKPEDNRPDPDADYDEDLGDEIEFDQGSIDEDDYDD